MCTRKLNWHGFYHASSRISAHVGMLILEQGLSPMHLMRSLLGSVQQAGVGCAHEDELGGDVPTLWPSVKSCSFLQDTTGCKVTGAVLSVCKASLLHLCVCPGVTMSLPTSCSHQFCFQLMHFSAGPFDI